MKIWKLEQLKQQPKVDEMVLAKAEEILKVLNVHYGDDRLVTDLGGYILNPLKVEIQINMWKSCLCYQVMIMSYFTC